MEKFRTHLNDELETRPRAVQFLEDNPELKKQFDDLQEAPERGPDTGRDLGMRNDFEPRRGQIEAHARKQLGSALQFGLDKDGRETYYQQLAQGVEEVWRSDIGEGQKSWGKNQTLEGRLHTERGLGEVAFYGERERALDRLETWLKNREERGESLDGLKLNALEPNEKKEIDNITGEIINHKEKVEEIDERIDEVREYYTTLQTERKGSKYAEVMEAGLKRTAADKQRGPNLPPRREFGNIVADGEKDDKTDMEYNTGFNSINGKKKRQSAFTLNDPFDEMLAAGLNIAGSSDNRDAAESLLESRSS